MNEQIDRYKFVRDTHTKAIPAHSTSPLPHEKIAALSAADLSTAYKQKTLSPIDVTNAIFERIKKSQDTLGAFFYLNESEAQKQAAASAKRWNGNAPLSELDGVPVSFKDEFEVQGWPAPHGTILRKDIIDETDGELVAKCRKAGMVFLGKTTMPDFGQTASSISSMYPLCHNPWDASKTVGGSSGGAACAVAARLGPIHMGADGGGSVRIPASYCGVFGHKPSRSRLACPVDDMIVQGPLTRTVEDAAMMMTVLSQQCDNRNDLLPVETDSYRDALDSLNLKDLKIGYRRWCGDGMHPTTEVLAATDKAIHTLRENGIRVENIEPEFLPGEIENAFPMIRLQVAHELLADFSPEQLKENVPEQLSRWLLDILEEDPEKIAAGGEPIFGNFFQKMQTDSFQRYSIVLSPTMPCTAHAVDCFTPPELNHITANEGLALHHIQPLPLANLWGNAAATLNCGFSKEGLPVGLHMLGKPGEDLKVLQTAHAIEKVLVNITRPWPM